MIEPIEAARERRRDAALMPGGELLAQLSSELQLILTRVTQPLKQLAVGLEAKRGARDIERERVIAKLPRQRARGHQLILADRLAARGQHLQRLLRLKHTKRNVRRQRRVLAAARRDQRPRRPRTQPQVHLIRAQPSGQIIHHPQARLACGQRVAQHHLDILR